MSNVDASEVRLLYRHEVTSGDVALGDGRYVHYVDVIAAIGEASYGLIRGVASIGEVVGPRLIGSGKH